MIWAIVLAGYSYAKAIVAPSRNGRSPRLCGVDFVERLPRTRRRVPVRKSPAEIREENCPS